MHGRTARHIRSYRHGRERLYVCLPDGRNHAWYDRWDGPGDLLDAAHEEDVLSALGPFSHPVRSRSARPRSHPRRAGPAVLVLFGAPRRRPRAEPPRRALLIDLDRDPGPAAGLRPDPRRRALAAKRAVAEALDRMDGAGWHALHSIPSPACDRDHHLTERTPADCTQSTPCTPTAAR
ncbi:hypothetical protein GCM10023238_20020 [Streptomyces heliomycini]